MFHPVASHTAHCFWICLLAISVHGLVSRDVRADDLVSLVKQSGVSGGLIVHVGCGDGSATAALLAGDRYLVQGLQTDAGQLDAARTHIEATGLYGKVSVIPFRGGKLPYTNDLVNLLIDSTGETVSAEELLRVLVPGGVAFIKTKPGGGNSASAENALQRLRVLGVRDLQRFGDWTQVRKPWPADIDDWTHFLHGPDNNAVARDERVNIPRSIQWVSDPRWARTHEGLASMSAAVCAKGRLIYVIDEAPLASIRFAGNWKLVGRDAFNGTLLWKKPIDSWIDPLRHFRSGPAHLPRRLIAVGDRVYVTLGLADPVVALDAATGAQRMQYVGTEHTEEILYDQGVLYLVVGSSEVNRRGEGLFDRGEPGPTKYRFIAAVDAKSGKQLWKKDCTKESVLPLTLAIKGAHVYYQSAFGMVCLDAKSGAGIWMTPRATPSRRMAFSAPTLVATDDVVLCADQDPGKTGDAESVKGQIEWGVNGWNEPGFVRRGKCTLRAYSAADGSELWAADCSEGYNSPVDLFVVGNTVWVGTQFVGLDLKTGTPIKQLDTKAPRVGMAHHRCYRDKASERFIFTGKSGIEVLGLDEGKWLSNNSWIRGTCAFGIIPANGFLYAPPDACACFLTVKSPGFFAAAPRREPTLGMPFPDSPVVENGLGYGATGNAIAKTDGAIATTADWPTYRHDAARSGTASTPIPSVPKLRWTNELKGRLTQSVVCGDSVFVASIDRHTLYALNLADGQKRWRFIAGGRIDSAPTIYRGCAYFGSADGWVYCVNAKNGQLVWRFRAAPETRLVGAYGQLESTWPTHGSVLIQNDTVYVTAGRSTYLDGGIVLYRLDPATGQPRSHTVVCELDSKTDKQLVPEARFNMEGTTNDVLSGNGSQVFLKYFTFDQQGQRTATSSPHLFSITGFLGEEWFVRSYWVVGQGMPDAGWSGWANAARKFPAGRILCFDSKRVYGYGRTKVEGGPVGHNDDTYQLFCSERKLDTTPAATVISRKGRATKKKHAVPQKIAPVWSKLDSLVVRAMVTGPERLAVAGPVDLGKKNPRMLAYENPREALAAFEGNHGAFLRLVSPADGHTLRQIELPALPVFDGMSAAHNCLLLSLKNGSVVCYEETIEK